MRLVIASAVLALGASAAPAQNVQAPARFNPAAPENRQVLPTFNYATVEAVLTQIGARFERRGTAERPVLTVTFANGRRAGILFGSCERQGAACKAISVQSVWPRPTGVPAERLATTIQGFNQRYAFSRAFITADGRPALQRYLTAGAGGGLSTSATYRSTWLAKTRRLTARLPRMIP